MNPNPLPVETEQELERLARKYGMGIMARAMSFAREVYRLGQRDQREKWGSTRQRDDLKTCPFCDTAAIQQGRLADNQTEQHWRILCGNPFCTVDCATHVAASIQNAEHFWQERRGDV